MDIHVLALTQNASKMTQFQYFWKDLSTSAGRGPSAGRLSKAVVSQPLLIKVGADQSSSSN